MEISRAQTATSSSYILESGDFSAIDFQATAEAIQIAGVSNAFGGNVYSYYTDNETGMYGNLFTGVNLRSFSLLSLGAEEATPSAWSVAIDKNNIELTNLSPGIPVQATTSITATSNVPTGYAIYIQENGPLTHQDVNWDGRQTNRNTIPDTQCDGGSCSETVAGAWANNDQAGFGYTVIGEDSLSDFESGTKFKVFPSAQEKESAIIIANDQSTNAYLVNRFTQVIYKVIIPPETEAGIYTNTISYTFVPTL